MDADYTIDHVLPEQDSSTREHVLTRRCWCCPIVHRTDGGEVITHQDPGAADSTLAQRYATGI